MSSTIKIKRSSVAGKKPSTGNLSTGELALNLSDGRLYSSNGTNVFEIGANVESLAVGSGTFSIANGAITFPTVDGSNGQILTTDGAGNLSFTTVTASGGGGSNTAIIRTVYNASGGETSVTPSSTYTPGQIDVYLNGILLINGTDYTATNGTTVTSLAPLVANDNIEIHSFSIRQPTQVTVSKMNYTASGGETSVDVTGGYAVGDVEVYLNGIMLVENEDYSATDGTSITGLPTLTSGDVVQIRGYTDFAVADIEGVLVSNNIGTTVQAYDSNLTDFVSAFTLPDVDSTPTYVLQTDGNGNLVLAPVANNSHNHVISNIDGLQSALDLKAAAADVAATYVTKSIALSSNNELKALIDDRLQVANADILYVTKSTALSSNNELKLLIDDRLQVANAQATYQTIANEQANLANTNAYIAGVQSNLDATNSNVDQKLGATASVTLTGAVTGSGSFSGNAISIATTATSDPTITLAGDLTGSVTLTNLGNGTLTATVVDDSHNHIIDNVDGLQSALDLKANLASPTFTGTVILPTATVTGSLEVDGDLVVSGNVVTINATELSLEDNMIYLNANNTVSNPDLGFAGNYNDGTYQHAGFFRDATDGYWKVYDSYTPEPDASPYIDTSHGSFTLADIQAANFRGELVGNASTATKLATARSIALGGDLSGSANFDGSAGITITATVADDSHNHIISNIDGLQSALDLKANLASPTFTGTVTLPSTTSIGSVSSTEIGYVNGVTSAIQTQLNAKQATITGAATTIDTENLTVSRALVSDGSGKVAVSAVTSTEVGYLDGVTSNIQTQLNAKQATITGAATTIDTENLTVSRALVSDGSGKVSVSAVTSTELGYLDGVTSNVQTQLNAKATSASVDNKLSLPTVKINNYTASHGEFIVVANSGITITLPSSPSVGDTVIIKDGTGNAATASFTIAGNGSNIASAGTDLVMDTNFAQATMVYIDASIGWTI